MAVVKDSEARERAFRVLYDAKWTDIAISRAFSCNPITVSRWRKTQALSRISLRTFDEAIARQLHSEGLSDYKIAGHFGLHQSAIIYWRQQRGIPANHDRPKRLSNEERRLALRMIKNGATKAKVAKAVGCCKETVQALRRGIKTGSPRPSGLTDTNIRIRLDREKNLFQRLNAAIGLHVPEQIREEAVYEMYADLLDGLVLVELIEQAAPTYRSRAYDMFGSKFGARSLDEEIGEDWTLGDTLDDPDALEAMEYAAEQAYENDNW